LIWGEASPGSSIDVGGQGWRVPALPVVRPGLPATAVETSLKEALTACDKARECAVTWFAEIKRRALHREPGYPTLHVYAMQPLGFSDNRYWQFSRLANDLERLPALAVETARSRARTSGADTRQPGQAGSASLFPPAAAGDPQPVACAATLTVTLRADALQLARFEALLEKAQRLRLLPPQADRMELVLAALDTLVAAGDAAAAAPVPAPRSRSSSSSVPTARPASLRDVRVRGDAIPGSASRGAAPAGRQEPGGEPRHPVQPVPCACVRTRGLDAARAGAGARRTARVTCHPRPTRAPTSSRRPRARPPAADATR
jgi:hypothetical protein